MYLKQNMPGVAYGLRLMRGARTGLGRSLGCAACAAPRRLGQDVYDPVTGTYGASLPTQDNPIFTAPVFGPAAPTPAQLQYDQIVTSGSTPNPAYNFQPLAQSSGLTLPSLPGISAPSVGVPMLGMAPVATPASSSSLSGYLPYLILGGGLIAVVAVLKRR